ncbi:hypothetical protein [Jeotgalibacillus sp. S-D1]|nr:hypothetical protein [Jeotgalibacillus sp. S-D1]
MANQTLPASIDELQDEGYLRQDENKCPDGRSLEIEEDGKVAIVQAP